jgi:hypothetical protein
MSKKKAKPAVRKKVATKKVVTKKAPRKQAATQKKVTKKKVTKKKATKKAALQKAGPKPKQILRGIPDIRRFFYSNDTPIYFISATNFNLLGADEWIKGFKFICYIECFDGDHPNVFSPQEEAPHEQFEGIEDINNYLLEHKEVIEYIESRRKGKEKSKAMFLMFDERTEKLAKQRGLEVCFPPAKMRSFMDNKVNTNRIAERAGVPCVPYVLTKVRNYKHLGKVAAKLGTDLVIQTPFGDSGHTTFFISNEAEFDKHKDEIVAEKEVKVMKRINCKGSAIEACVTQHGTVVAPLMTELVGFKELTPYKGGWCGNEIYPDAFNRKLRKKASDYTRQFGDQLREEGYKGYFELDFLIDQDNGEIYLGELNPRITGASSITNHALFALADMPLFLFHLLEWMDQPYTLNTNVINRRWNKPENCDSWGQLILKHTNDDVRLVTKAPRSGIWRMSDDGKLTFNRMDTHRRAVETEAEAFFLRITRKGDYLYEGADVGILVMRGRLMTDDGQLSERARAWIDAVHGMYKSAPLEPRELTASRESEIASFKMM